MSEHTLDTAAVDHLATTFGGRIVLPGDDAYDEARMVWNGLYDRRPALMAQCASAADVAAAVGFARDSGLPLSVRGGGHGANGYGTCDDGVVIDLAPMKGIEVDPVARTARAGGGTTWASSTPRRRSTASPSPAGASRRPGIAGLTLGSGSGWLERKCGLTGDNLIGAEVVTADGQTSPPARTSTPTCSGHPRRRRQLRGRHVVRVPPAPGRADGLGGMLITRRSRRASCCARSATHATRRTRSARRWRSSPRRPSRSSRRRCAASRWSA